MESKSLLESIKSKVIFRQLFSYTKETKKLKLVIYSKKFQDILNITLNNYKEKCYESFKHINLLNFLSNKNKPKSEELGYYVFKKILKRQFNDEIKNTKAKKIVVDEYVEYYFNNLYNEYKNNQEVEKNILDNQLMIDIYSPFYESLMEKDFFGKLFMLYIPFPLIYQRKLMDDYYNATDLLKEKNPEFSSFYYEINGVNDIYDFKDFCNYFDKIKKLHVEIKSNTIRKKEIPFEIFSFKNIKDNLIFLELKFNRTIPVRLSDSFEKKLDDLNFLEELRLEGIGKFHLKKKNLKYLYFSNIGSLSFDSNCFSNVEIINLFEVQYFKSDIPNIKIPELKKFKTSFINFPFKTIFDFKSCTKLKYFRANIDDFLSLGNTLLEKVYIRKYSGDETKMIKKLIEIKTLKEIKIDITRINNEDIELIKGENTSVEKLIVNWENNDNNHHAGDLYAYFINGNNDNTDDKIILYGLQNKFPNLKEFQIYIGNKSFYSSNENLLEINPNPNCKINKFKYSAVQNIRYTTIFYTAPYENLVDIEFGCMMFSSNLDKSFPLFSENCKYIFESLIRFKLDNTKVNQLQLRGKDYKKKFDIKIIKNVINNLDKMPNLKNFIFKVFSQTDEVTYKQLIEKLLSSNIKNIEFKIFGEHHKEEYSIDELKNMFKSFDIKKFESIHITKYKNNNEWKLIK